MALSTASFSATEREAAVGHPKHEVQFYEEEDFLYDVVARYLAEGFGQGEPAVVIATEPHRRGICARLQARHVEVEQVLSSGQLVLLDARETLGKFMVRGAPDAAQFQKAVGPVLSELLLRFAGHPVRAYAEMVDLLWRERNREAAVEVEQLWNGLQEVHPFKLLCAYVMHNFRNESDAKLFHQVCGAHSHVVPTERYSRVESDDARLREVSVLQQRARALETEIDHRRKVEAELLDALRLRDEFLSIAGHELKTPLTALQLQVHSLLALSTARADEQLKGRLDRAFRQTERLRRLVDDLLDVARISAGGFALHREECDVSALVLAVVDRASETAARAGSQLTVEAAPGVTGQWDRFRLDQVVSNIVANALKYGAGKPVRVELGATASLATLKVRDQGIGIPLEDQWRIFSRFERAASSRNFGGLGLGLWIVREVVQAHGGQVWVDSQPGSGATFTVELPLAN